MPLAAQLLMLLITTLVTFVLIAAPSAPSSEDVILKAERAYVAAFRASCPGFVIENFEIKSTGERITSLKCTEMDK